MRKKDGCTRVQRKIFCFDSMLKIIIAASLMLPCLAFPERQYATNDNSVSMIDNGEKFSCRLDTNTFYAIESYDGDAVIISDRGYIKRADLYRCAESVIPVMKIPNGVGFLSDINLKNDIYISLDFVIDRPLRYLATVAKLRSRNNLVTINGAYEIGVPMKELRKHSFETSGGPGASIISIDGKYVAPDGVIDCSDSAFPGVWDIVKNTRVTTDASSCASFFHK